MKVDFYRELVKELASRACPVFSRASKIFYSTLTFSFLVLAGTCICMTGCQTNRAVDFDSLNPKLLAQIKSKETSDEILLQSISRLGKVLEPPIFWTSIANDGSYSIKHRSRCIMALFRRHGQRCDSTRQLAKVLAPANWLHSNDVNTVEVLAGFVPVSPGPDRTVLVISVFPETGYAAYLSVLGKMDKEEFYKMICDSSGKHNAVIVDYGFVDDYDRWMSNYRQ